jgi:hypothetical protein
MHSDHAETQSNLCASTCLAPDGSPSRSQGSPPPPVFEPLPESPSTHEKDGIDLGPGPFMERRTSEIFEDDNDENLPPPTSGQHRNASRIPLLAFLDSFLHSSPRNPCCCIAQALLQDIRRRMFRKAQRKLRRAENMVTKAKRSRKRARRELETLARDSLWCLLPEGNISAYGTPYGRDEYNPPHQPDIGLGLGIPTARAQS